MDDFHNLSPSINAAKKEQDEIKTELQQLNNDISSSSTSLNDLESRLLDLYKRCGYPNMPSDDVSIGKSNNVVKDIDKEINLLFLSKDKISQLYALNKVDILIACLTGGIAVLVDFLVVKTPKSLKVNGNDITGSPLTDLIKQIGLTDDNKEAKWVQSLEKWFHVDYDPSIKENIEKMYPKNHRIFSLGHDPSIMGLIWGIKDIVCGTFSYINADGILCIDKVAKANFKNLFYAPILWLGHLISDMFTKAGLPIPGGCALRVLQFGNFSEKDKTIGELIEYMYVTGYDLRHLAVASICNIVIELIIRIYMFLLGNVKDTNVGVLFEEQYNHVKNYRKKHKLLIASYSVASCGNIVKIAMYNGAPNAINLPIWYGFVKEAIIQLGILTSDSNKAIEAIEDRHLINERFEALIKMGRDF